MVVKTDIAVTKTEMEYKQNGNSLPKSLRTYRTLLRILERITPSITTKIVLRRFYRPKKRKKKHYSIIPVENKKHAIFYNNRKINVREWGKGPVILFVHGWEGNSLSIREGILPITKNGYSLISVDFPAHGESSGTETSMYEFIAVIKLIEEKFGPIYATVAHSLGGLATMNAIHRGFEIERVILISSLTSIEMVTQRFANILNISDNISERIVQDIEKKFKDHKISDYSLNSISSSLKIPALIIHDKQDKLVSYEAGKDINSKWQGSDIVTTTGLGHHRILRDKNVIEKIIQFLN